MTIMTYSQTCFQRSPLRTKEKCSCEMSDHLLKIVDSDRQFHSLMICVLLLPDGKYFENMEVVL
jgi:hypothetical protein